LCKYKKANQTRSFEENNVCIEVGPNFNNLIIHEDSLIAASLLNDDSRKSFVVYIYSGHSHVQWSSWVNVPCTNNYLDDSKIRPVNDKLVTVYIYIIIIYICIQEQWS